MSLPIILGVSLIAGSAFGNRCQSSDEIRDHVAIVASSGLIRYSEKGATAIDDINSRFCVHTVKDGTRRLGDGRLLNNISGLQSALYSLIGEDYITQKGLQVAFSDVEGSNHGATFYEAQIACEALTLNGAARGQWRLVRSRFGWNNEPEWGISAESLLVYFSNDNLYDFGRGRFWTASHNQLNGKVYRWVLNLADKCSSPEYFCGKMVHHESETAHHGVMCIRIPDAK